ncbi:MAG: MOSC N-terminal beta barrel domain-containing protein [Candidatus Nanopelagicales bacterium]
MELTALRVYPVKSLRGHAVDSAVVEPWGLAGDRRWALLTPSGEEVTAREHPALLLIRPSLTEDGALLLHARGQEPLTVAVPTSGPTYVSDWIGRTTGADPLASAWLSDVLGIDVVLVHQQDPVTDRNMSPDHGGRPGDNVNLADDAPLLLTSTSSLSRLDTWMQITAQERSEPAPEPLSMVRFRPNLVIDGDEPFIEDLWRRIRIGNLELRFAACCDRCVLPTYDPDTLAKTHEPTRTLARHRSWGGKVWFGIRLVPVGTGTLHVGDAVTRLE